MKKISIVWISLILVTTISLFLIGILVANKTKPYKALEKNIVEAMKVYYGQDSNLKKLPDKNREAKISIGTLKAFGLKINTKVGDDECEGFGIVRGQNVSFSYTAFIKCDNYTTDKYAENK